MTEVGEERRTDTWFTPNGHPVTFEYRFRPETTDWNSISSILINPAGPGNGDDEYQIRGMNLSGWAIDVGCHVGSMAIALAADFPDLKVLAIEAVPPNVELIRRNIELNHFEDRIVLIHGGANGPTEEKVRIAWNWDGSQTPEIGKQHQESLTGHRFIGGSSLMSEHAHPIKHDELVLRSWSLRQLADEVGTERFSFLKIDCEGCEQGFLDDPDISMVDYIIGEWHPPYVSPKWLRDKLGPTHDVEVSDGPGPGHFKATRRG